MLVVCCQKWMVKYNTCLTMGLRCAPFVTQNPSDFCWLPVSERNFHQGPGPKKISRFFHRSSYFSLNPIHHCKQLQHCSILTIRIYWYLYLYLYIYIHIHLNMDQFRSGICIIYVYTYIHCSLQRESLRSHEL